MAQRKKKIEKKYESFMEREIIQLSYLRWHIIAMLAYCFNIRAKPCCVETYKNARPAHLDLDFCYSDSSDDDNSNSEREKMIIGTSRAVLVDCIYLS